MIKLTRLNGSVFSLNPDLIHRAEETPDTVLTLIDGSRYVVLEKLDELVSLVVGYRARVVAQAGVLAEAAYDGPQEHPAARRADTLSVVPADPRGPHGQGHAGDLGDLDDLDDLDDLAGPGGADHDTDRRPTGASVVRLRARRA